MSDALAFGILGPVRAWRGGAEVNLGSPKQRGLLSLLLLRTGRAVSQSEILDALWDQDMPACAGNVIHRYVAGLRKALEPDRRIRSTAQVLTSVSGAYLLRIDRSQLDLCTVEDGLARARELRDSGRLAEALQVFESLLAVWQGTPLTGIRCPFAALERSRLVELRTTVAEERVEVMVSLGRNADAVAELSALVQEHPLRERLRGLLMLALYRGGRQAEALRLFRETRRILIDELGVEPSQDLQRLHERMLAGAPSLFLPAVAVTAEQVPQAGRRQAGLPPTGKSMVEVSPAAGRPVIPAQLPHDLPNFAGREAQLAAIGALLDRSANVPGEGNGEIVVIDGPAGVGKTALAIHFAHLAAHRFDHGQIYVNLRGFDPARPPLSADDALDRILQSLAIDASLIPASLDAKSALYRSLLAGKRPLITLDNAVSAEQIRPLLPGKADFLSLITSRNQLSDLIARDGAERVHLPVFTADEAITLLRKISGGRTDADPDAAAEVARLCGYLPLALRIAAQRIVSRPNVRLADLVREFARENRRLDLFNLGDDGASGVRTAFSCSYQALPTAAADMFRRLGQHPDPEISLSTVASLAQIKPAEARQVLHSLAQVHLLDEIAHDRYSIPVLEHAYARELAAATEMGAGAAPAVQDADAAMPRSSQWWSQQL